MKKILTVILIVFITSIMVSCTKDNMIEAESESQNDIIESMEDGVGNDSENFTTVETVKDNTDRKWTKEY